MKLNISSFASGFGAAPFTSLNESRNEYAARLNCSRAAPFLAKGSIALSCGADSAASVLIWRKRRRERDGTAGENGEVSTPLWLKFQPSISAEDCAVAFSRLKTQPGMVLGAGENRW